MCHCFITYIYDVWKLGNHHTCGVRGASWDQNTTSHVYMCKGLRPRGFGLKWTLQSVQLVICTTLSDCHSVGFSGGLCWVKCSVLQLLPNCWMLYFPVSAPCVMWHWNRAAITADVSSFCVHLVHKFDNELVLSHLVISFFTVFDLIWVTNIHLLKWTGL